MNKEDSRYTTWRSEDDYEPEGYELIQGTGSITTLDTSARQSPKQSKKRKKKKIPFGFQAPQKNSKPPR